MASSCHPPHTLHLQSPPPKTTATTSSSCRTTSPFSQSRSVSSPPRPSTSLPSPNTRSTLRTNSPTSSSLPTSPRMSDRPTHVPPTMTPTDTTSLTSPPPHPLSSSSTLRTFTSTTIPTSIPPSPHSTLPCAMNHTRIHPLHSSIVIPHRPLIAPALGLVHLPSVRRDPPVAIVGPTPSPRTFQALVPRPDPTPTPLSSPAAAHPASERNP